MKNIAVLCLGLLLSGHNTKLIAVLGPFGFPEIKDTVTDYTEALAEAQKNIPDESETIAFILSEKQTWEKDKDEALKLSPGIDKSEPSSLYANVKKLMQIYVQNPLIIAAKTGRLDSIKEAHEQLSKNEDAEKRANKESKTKAFKEASQRGISKESINLSYNLSSPWTPCYAGIKTRAFQAASKFRRSKEILSYLLDIAAQNRSDLSSLLIAACYEGNKHAVELVLKKNTDSTLVKDYWHIPCARRISAKKSAKETAEREEIVLLLENYIKMKQSEDDPINSIRTLFPSDETALLQ